MAEASTEAIRIFLDVEDELVDSSRTDRSCVRMDFADLPLNFHGRLPNHFVGVLWWMPGRVELPLKHGIEVALAA